MKNKMLSSIPAFLSDFEVVDDGRTKAKLKTFYVGETADGRLFDEAFSEKLADTISGAPVVGYFSTAKGDFLGHNPTQYVYGFVNPIEEKKFEVDENGLKWLIASIELFTNRGDDIGAVAKKIVGHPQSLELNGDSLEYEIIKDQSGKRKIHFIKGSIIGLSVLGMTQKPAFTGSAFFNAEGIPEDRVELKKSCEHFQSILEEEAKERGEEMKIKKEDFNVISSFYEMTYVEKTNSVAKTLQKELGEDCGLYIADMTDDYCVADIMDYNTYERHFERFYYNINEANEITFEAGVEVYTRYLTEEEMNKLKNVEEPPVETNLELETKPEEDSNMNSTVEKTDLEIAVEMKGKPENEKKEEEVNAQKDETNYSVSSASALSDSEKEELKELRNEKKRSLIDTYKGDLEEDDIKDYKAKVDEYDFKDLEVALALSFRKATIKKEQITSKVAKPFKFNLNSSSETSDAKPVTEFARLVEKYKNGR